MQQATDSDAKPVISTVHTGSEQPTHYEYPVREYIAAMSRELAQMARWDGDEGLGALLDTVTTHATSPAPGPGLSLPD